MSHKKNTLRELGSTVTWSPQGINSAKSKGFSYYVMFVVLLVLLLHIAFAAALLTQTSKKQLELVASKPVVVSVNLVKRPPPPVVEPTPPKPKVLASNKSEAKRVVEKPKVEPKPKPKPKVEPKPKVVPKPILKPEPKPVLKPKPVPKPESKPKPVPKTVPKPEPKPTPPVVQPVQAKEHKELTKPSAGPKDVQRVGCSVPAPVYPRKALRLGRQGDVVVLMVIDASGNVTSARVARSSGFADLDQAAQEAVMKSSCTPYIENGRAITVRAAQPITFRLR